jgi:hypothetical protein
MAFKLKYEKSGFPFKTSALKVGEPGVEVPELPKGTNLIGEAEVDDKWQNFTPEDKAAMDEAYAIKSRTGLPEAQWQKYDEIYQRLKSKKDSANKGKSRALEAKLHPGLNE